MEIQAGKKGRGDQTGKDVRKVHAVIAETVEFNRIQRWKEIAGDSACCQSLEWTSQQIGEKHHPTSSKAHAGRKDASGVGDFRSCIRHKLHQLAVHVSAG